MPKTAKCGQPRAEELPGTLRRSPRKAQRTLAKAHGAPRGGMFVVTSGRY